MLDWRPPIDTTSLSTGTEEESRNLAAYVQILNWFMDDPAAICPFSVHRMALIGKQLGKEVGEWFGPSTAAGAIKCVQGCPT
jgi:cysteine protease ATG4